MPRSAGSESSLQPAALRQTGMRPTAASKDWRRSALSPLRAAVRTALTIFSTSSCMSRSAISVVLCRAPLGLPAGLPDSPFLKPVSKNWACIFSHGRKSLPKRFVVFSNVS